MNNPLIPEPWGAFAPSRFVLCWLKVLHSFPTNPFWRRSALWLRKPLKSILQGWVDVEIWGLRLRLRARGNLSEQRMIFMPQFLDEIERVEIGKVLESGGVFLDIGANAGVYSLWVASLKRTNVQIESFEPDPDLCAALEFNLRSNDIQTVTINPIALGREQGRMNLIAGDGNKGENRVVTNNGSNDGSFVEMKTLPQFLDERGITSIQAIKIDIEGYEVDALEPLFSECPPSVWPKLLVCEVVHDSDDRLINLLRECGYRLHVKGRLNGVYIRS